MNHSQVRSFRLVSRGAGGLACDEAGISLGSADLVRVSIDAAGRRRCEARPSPNLGQVLSAAYGPQPEDSVLRIHRGLRRAACAIEAGELCLAGIETVLLALPDLTPSALAKLGYFAELEKDGTSWQDQPRVLAGQPGGGQWTDEAGGAPAFGAAPASDGATHAPTLPLYDGIYRPGTDSARVILTGGAEGDEPARRSNGPPDDFTSLEDVFPGLRETPALAIPLAPIDGFLATSALADEANLEATLAQYDALIADIKQTDPHFANQELLPPGGIAGLSWQGRTNLINDLRMQRAAAYYRVLGDVEPLQVETLRFLQDAVDAAYGEAVAAADSGRLQPRLSRAEAIGNWVDAAVRTKLKRMFEDYDIPFGPRADLMLNNRDYETSENNQRYWVPDARLRDVSFDWTLSLKTIQFPQIRGFFRTDSRVRAVVIIRPSLRTGQSIYLIARPTSIP